MVIVAVGTVVILGDGFVMVARVASEQPEMTRMSSTTRLATVRWTLQRLIRFIFLYLLF
jgi:hypothetical protein